MGTAIKRKRERSRVLPVSAARAPFRRRDLAESRLEHAEAQAAGARREVAEVVLDSTIPAEAVRAEVLRRVPLERLSELVRQGLGRAH